LAGHIFVIDVDVHEVAFGLEIVRFRVPIILRAMLAFAARHVPTVEYSQRFGTVFKESQLF